LKLHEIFEKKMNKTAEEIILSVHLLAANNNNNTLHATTNNNA